MDTKNNFIDWLLCTIALVVVAAAWPMPAHAEEEENKPLFKGFDVAIYRVHENLWNVMYPDEDLYAFFLVRGEMVSYVVPLKNSADLFNFILLPKLGNTPAESDSFILQACAMYSILYGVKYIDKKNHVIGLNVIDCSLLDKSTETKGDD